MIIAVVGPTCSHKTELAIRLAKLTNAEIINFDAYQVYKELNIGTAKPTNEELTCVKSHMFSCISIKDDFNIYLYQKTCRYLIEKLIHEGKNIVLVGGSGLYLRAALYDYIFNEEPKKNNQERYALKTNEELYAMLKQVDPESANKIHVNNRKRVIRALEIFDETNVKKSLIESTQEHKLIYDTTFIGLNPDRDELYSRINARVDQMFENGLVDEATSLFEKNSKDLQGLQAIGYKEFTLGLSLEETKELIKKNTRNYAKRQITFFKHQFDNVNWFNDINLAFQFIKNTL